MGNEKILVSICCTVYNHENYIQKCLEGFLEQETDFEYEILVFDDASKDNSQEIIKRFADKNPSIKTFLQTENQWVQKIYGLIDFMFPAAKGEYIALCEGDDYWTDPLKLQKQVDLIRRSKDCNMVVSDSQYLYQATDSFKDFNVPSKFISSTNKVSLEYIFLKKGVVFSTASFLFKKHILDNAFDELLKNISVGDRALQLRAILDGSIYIVPEQMTVYRVAFTGSSWTAANSSKYDPDRLTRLLKFQDFLNKWSNYKFDKYIGFSKSGNVVTEVNRSSLKLSKWQQLKLLFRHRQAVTWSDWFFILPRVALKRNRLF
ncbi:Glycosyl transferase family 2 [Nonlabens sp. Hel1_33_55]|uniref:glycosyltransferase family 2 protein n=1 Tax=Nonlabens sp. Hel1_33_55 TaxID=1336802 RepID=UPI000875C098|nr:glycosyltransferase [Nonlabens sp. Hel1_33_55]SCX94291.1 Glycosyl transferase family 2 [Nonlabens sp. Hel1_33_55]